MTNLIRELGKEGVLLIVGYNNDSPTYGIYYNTNSKIVSSRNVTFIECVESKTPSMVDDIDEGSKSSDDLENNVYDGIQHLESTTLDNVEGSHGPVRQYNRMTLRASRKSRDNLTEAKSLNSSRESRSENQLAMPTLETVLNYCERRELLIYKVHQSGIECIKNCAH